jgi:hypothetical protein
MKLIVLLMLFSISAFAQTLHVNTVRLWQPTDAPRVSRSFETYVVEGTLDGKHYTLQQLKSWGTHLVQIGQDYPVVKQTDRRLDVMVTDKKGKAWKENLDVTGVSE